MRVSYLDSKLWVSRSINRPMLLPFARQGELNGEAGRERHGLRLSWVAHVALASFEKHPNARLADVSVQVALLQASSNLVIGGPQGGRRLGGAQLADYRLVRATRVVLDRIEKTGERSVVILRSKPQ